MSKANLFGTLGEIADYEAEIGNDSLAPLSLMGKEEIAELKNILDPAEMDLLEDILDL